MKTPQVDLIDAVVAQVAIERGSDEDAAAASALANDMLAFCRLEAGEEIGLLAQKRAMVARDLAQAVFGFAQHLEGRLELQRCVDHVHAATAGLFDDGLRIDDSGIDLLPVLKYRIDAAGRGEPLVDILDQDQRAIGWVGHDITSWSSGC